MYCSQDADANEETPSGQWRTDIVTKLLTLEWCKDDEDTNFNLDRIAEAVMDVILAEQGSQALDCPEMLKAVMSDDRSQYQFVFAFGDAATL